ncbi:MAG: hypothetical protein NXI10_01270 [bacterium]|nr:hypothetical protein [bacterium]
MANLDRDISNDALFFDELQEGFDAYFYAPLVTQLHGPIRTCEIRSVIPDSIVEATDSYLKRKAIYDNADANQRLKMVKPIKNQGVELYQSSFYLDSNKQLIRAEFGTLMAWNVNDMSKATTSGSLYWQYDEDQIAQWYLSGDAEDRQSDSAYFSVVHCSLTNALPELTSFDDEFPIETSPDSSLIPLAWPDVEAYKNAAAEYQWQTENEWIRTGNSESRTTLMMINKQTEEKSVCSEHRYSSSGLLLESRHNQEGVCRNRNLSDMVYYSYNKRGHPNQISSVKGQNLPKIVAIEWSLPDAHGNYQLMQVRSNSGALIREFSWTYTYFD